MKTFPFLVPGARHHPFFGLVGGGAVLISLFVSATALRAGIGVFDWEAGTGCASTWSADGIVITNSRGTICSSSGTGINSLSNGTRFANDVQGLKMVHSHGLPFTPVGIDVGEYSRSVKDASVGFVGYKADGSVVSAQAPLDGVADGPGGAEDFETFGFPAEFADIVRLEVPTGAWSFDNFVFSTLIPPPLPAKQDQINSFGGFKAILSKSIFSDLFVLGPDYFVTSGFSPPRETQFVRPGDTRKIGGTLSVFFSPEASAFSYTNYARDTVMGERNGVVSTLATALDTAAAGWPMPILSRPRWAGGAVVFVGYYTGDSGSFGIFRKESGITQALVTPETLLPDPGGGSPSTPYDAPQQVAFWSGGFAFDTSLATAPSLTRLYVGDFGANFRCVVGENDWVALPGGTAQITQIKTFTFRANGDLEVDVVFSAGSARLVYGPSGLIGAQSTTLTVAPCNAGKMVTGTLVPSTATSPALLTTTAGEIFRESDGSFYRVLGVGDVIGGETISLLELKAVPWLAPARIVVEVRYASAPTTAHILELDLVEPAALPPLFGGPYIHPETGDWFVPLSRITAGKTRWLSKSFDLQNWERLWRVETVSPVQSVFIPREHSRAARVFFRVEEE